MNDKASSMVRKTDIRGEEFLQASINHPDLKLHISSKDTSNNLAEIRRILECLYQENDVLEDFTAFELGSMLSEEFVNNQEAMKEVRKLVAMEQQYRVVKELICAIEEIDLVAGKKQLRVQSQSIKQSIGTLVQDVDTSKIRHALVHIKGLLPSKERLVIVDRIHEKIPHAQIKAYQSNQDIEGKVLVEAMFFGDFPNCE